jgi:hypothetical protein
MPTRSRWLPTMLSAERNRATAVANEFNFWLADQLAYISVNKTRAIDKTIAKKALREIWE